MQDDPPKSADVIAMTRRTAMSQPLTALHTVKTYWDGLAADGEIPNRTDVNPRALEEVLGYTFILERIAPGIARLRLAGHHLNDLMGLEVRGMPLTTLFAPVARGEISQVIENTCVAPAISEISLVATGGFGRPALKGKMLLAPLRDDQGQNTRILGCLQVKGTIGRQPRRFIIDDVSSQTVATGGAMALNALPPQEMAFSEAPAPFIHAPKPSRLIAKRPGLHLVVDND